MKIQILILFLFLIISMSAGKVIVMYKPDTTYTMFNTAVVDSCVFSRDGDSLITFTKTGVSTTYLSDIDSIHFFDGASIQTADMLYNSAYAAPAITDSQNTFVTLDLRNRTIEDTAVIITDSIDIIDISNSFVANDFGIDSMFAAIRASLPLNSQIRTYWSSGNAYFCDSLWSNWTEVSGLNFNIETHGSRYIKLRIVMKAASISSLPKINSIALFGNMTKGVKYEKPIHVDSFQNEKIITGPYPFGWETRNNVKISGLISNFHLDTCGKDSTTEFGRVIALLNWVARRPRGSLSVSIYPWDLDQVITSTGTIKGHCMSYAEVMISALTGLGYYARHWAIEGIDNINNHEVVEYWSDQYRKWIYIDPSLDTYYKSVSTGLPNSILENHNYYINHQYSSIACVDGKYHYGVYTPSYYWRGSQGYTTCGHMKLTERNNFHSQPTPIYNGFGLGFCGFSDLSFWHNWSDWATPIYTNLTNPQYDCKGTKITCQSGRKRDFWYTLNQASIKAKRSGEKEITIEFGQSQPFFSHYEISTSNGIVESDSSLYKWVLLDGANTLKVTPVNIYNEKGLPSLLSLYY